MLSRIAEGYFRSTAGGRAEAVSAGITAEKKHPSAAGLMKEEGIELHDQPSKTITELAGSSFDLVISISGTADATPGNNLKKKLLRIQREDPVVMEVLNTGLPNRLNWRIPPPSSTPDTPPSTLAELRRTRDRIRESVDALVSQGYLDAFAAGKARLEGILDLLDEGILVHDDLQHIYLFNRAAEQITGYDRKKILGRHCHDVFPPSGLCGSWCSFADSAFAGDKKKEHEALIVTPGGEERSLKIKTALLESDSPILPGRVFAAFQDITELKTLQSTAGMERNLHGIITASPGMFTILDTIRRVSASGYSVLITGESGTGKELVAKAVHKESTRKGGPFVPVNCGALPEGVLESELFGHVRGAFTGAIRDKKGRFELADGGTLFLDEIGELSEAFQVKLLRVLQEMEIERVGGERTIKIDVRVIAASNRDLRKMVHEGGFRQDLFYRICVVPISLPPLRERREDIPLLVEHFLMQIRKETGRKKLSVSTDAVQLLVRHHWPGNVRELLNVLQFASLQGPNEIILSEHMPPDLISGAGPPFPESFPEAPGSPGSSAESLEKAPGARGGLTRECVLEALEKTGGNKLRAAKLLGIGRATLYRYFKKHPL